MNGKLIIYIVKVYFSENIVKIFRSSNSRTKSLSANFFHVTNFTAHFSEYFVLIG